MCGRCDYGCDMSSLRKDAKGRSPFWIACYTAADGRRLQKSTKQTDRKKALEVCLTLERAEEMARRGTLTENRARQLIGEILERTTGDALPRHTLEGWLRDWLKNKVVSTAASTHGSYRKTIEAFLASLGGRAKLNITAIAPADISRFRDEQLGTGKSPSTVCGMIRELRVPFNVARRQGILASNPAEAVDMPTLTKGKGAAKSSRKPFTTEQVAALMDAATSADWRGAILFSYCTGARLADVGNLTWDAINLPGKLVTYTAKKTGTEVTIPLHPSLEAHLLEMPAPDTGKAFIFPSLAGHDVSRLSGKFAQIMARAGVRGEAVHEPKEGSKGRKTWTLSFHSLRHAFVSEMANAGVSSEIRQQFAGHASAEMNAKYTHHELAPLRAAIATIPGPGGRKAAK